MENLNNQHLQQTTRKSCTNAILKCKAPSSPVIYLPIEIISNILSRLPVQTLLQFRSVCKAWSNLTRTDAFIYQHMENFSKNEADHGFIALTGVFNKITLEYSTQGHSRFLKLDNRSSAIYHMSDICNGLIIFYGGDGTDDRDYTIVNPAVDDKFIKLPNVGMTKARIVPFVRLYHDRHSNKHKVVRFFLSGAKATSVEVLTLGDTSWKQVGEFPDVIKGAPVYVSGTIHWLTYGGKILYFKITDETRGMIETPICGDNREDEIKMRTKNKNLINYDGFLCIVKRQRHMWRFMFFIMEDYVNRVWVQHEIDVMQIRKTFFSSCKDFDHYPKCRFVKVHNGKLLLEFFRILGKTFQRKFFYYDPKTRSLNDWDDVPVVLHQVEYKESSLISAKRLCDGGN